MWSFARRLGAGLWVAVLVGCAAPPAGPGAPGGPSLVRIGHVGPVTGALAQLGIGNEQGARLAVDELNARGVSIGGRPVRIELVVEDDASNPQRAVAAAQRLVAAGVHGVVGHLSSGTTIPASRVYHDAGIVQVSPSATNPRYTRQGFATAFRILADDARLGRALGQHAVRRMGGSRIAVIDDRTAYGAGLAEEFERGVAAAGGRTQARLFTNDKATEFSALLADLKAQDPDLVFFGGMDTVAGPLLDQMRRAGLRAPLLGGDGICSDGLPRLARGAMSDLQVSCAEAGGQRSDDAAGRAREVDFVRRYRQRFQSEPPVYAGQAYDAVSVLVAAMVTAGSTDPARYRPVLAALRGHAGVSGEISFEPGGDNAAATVTLYSFRDGRRTRTQVVLADAAPQPGAAAEAATAPVAAAAPAATTARCDDPLLDTSRFQVTDLEITDKRTSLVWFRCPALWVGSGNRCDGSRVLPATTWASAVKVPNWAPKRPTPWRLASVEELDTIAAKGCGYLVNPKFIELMFPTVWTRTPAAGNKVLAYGDDRARLESPRQAPRGEPEIYRQLVFVRAAR